MTEQKTLSPYRNTRSGRIAQEFRSRIEDGTYAPGARLPSVYAIAVRFGVSMNIARRVFYLLRQEGVVVAKIGNGHFVTHPAAETTSADS